MFNIRYCNYININKGSGINDNHVPEKTQKKNSKEPVKQKEEQVNPPPPQDISKENLSLWIGWTYRSDRELIREAASKGHVSLAETFLILRNNSCEEEVKENIKREVLAWSNELLERKLIFRVSSILENIHLDPVFELQNIFYKTKVRNLREYIGIHLKKIEKLPSIYEDLWTFLEIIIDNKVLTYQRKLHDESIEGLDRESDMWKKEVASKLFINIHDNRLTHFTNAEKIWKQLLIQNEIYIINTWIQMAFCANPPADLNIPENILVVLKTSAINDTMLNQILSSNLPSESVDNILNQLAKLGIFIEGDKENFLCVLSRINTADNIGNIYDILSQPSSNISLSDFVYMLAEYAMENNLLVLFSACLDHLKSVDLSKNVESPHVRLMQDFQNLVKDFKKELLCDNVYKVSKYLSNGDMENYFCDNPFILLSLIIFTPNIFVEEVLQNKSLPLYECDVYKCFSSMFDSSTLLRKLYLRKTNPLICKSTYFDLLEKHHGLNTKKMYSFKFEKQPLPSFCASLFPRDVVYSKNINYTFYLKSGRPSMASKYFFLDELKNHSVIRVQHCVQAKEKVFKTALTNYYNISLTAACISFLEMIGIDSHLLRIAVQTANIITHFNSDLDIVPLLLNMEEDAYAIQVLLDEAITTKIDFEEIASSGDEFIKCVKRYEIVLEFSLLHQLPLPELFLTRLSQNNLWFQFLLYAQLKNYPIDQVKSLCANFKNPSLLEHIVHSVTHNIEVKELNALLKKRNSRNYLLSKLGVRKVLEKMSERDSLNSRSTFSGSLESNFSSFELDQLEIDLSNTKATLLQTLIRCHNSTDPPKALLQASYFYKNPLLSILATSYEPDSVITHWLTWLCVSTNLHEVYTNMETLGTNAQSVSDLLNNCMVNRYPRTLLESFVIFVPDNPLTLFIDFLNQIIDKDYYSGHLKIKLKRFKDLNHSRRISVVSQTDFEMTYLKNKLWIETTALRLLHSSIIYNTSSYYEQLEFVTVLSNLNMKQYFTCEQPDFTTLLQILETVFYTEVKLNIEEYLDSSRRQEGIQECIEKLIKVELFEHALNIAKVCDIDTNFITLKKWQRQYENRKCPIQDFLKLCNKDFLQEGVLPEYVISFFKERVAVNDIEKYFLLKASHKWAVDQNLTNKYELERKKIIAFLNIPDNNLPVNELAECDESNEHISYKEMRKMLENVFPVQESLTQDHSEKLNEILVKFLDQGNFWLALRLGKMFGCDNVDIEVLKFCYELAEEIVLPHHLSDKKNPTFTKFMDMPRGSYRRNLTYRNVSISSDKNYLELLERDDFDSPMSQDSLVLIHTLVGKLKHGVDLGYSIFMKYRISRNIDVPYNVVVSSTDRLSMLKQALQDDCMNKLDVVHDFFNVFRWTKDEVTNFLCDQFVQSVSNYSKSNTASFTMWDVRLDLHFHVILKLFKDDCYTLGYKFLHYATNVHQQQAATDINFKISEMALVVELLIAAHACFTIECNMEGISLVLRKCRTVISHLLTVRSWKLIVRLFTGVGRYTELNFVFDILKENHQFEFLLNKGTNRDDQLKQASFEYLKKHCPDDKELYRLIAIHFSMYSDIADDYEREGNDYIKQLATVSKEESNETLYLVTKNDITRELLHKAMDCYVLAAEYHVEGQKMAKAMNAIKQSELIAIQKALLAPLNQQEKAPLLFDLDSTQIETLISSHLNFHQTIILIEAYNYTPDWASIIFEQTIQKNNLGYFESFMEIIDLDEQLVQDIGRKFIASNVGYGTGYKNMTYIICCLRSIHLKYRLASEFGFTKLVEELISTGDISYLKDTVWKKGYKG